MGEEETEEKEKKSKKMEEPRATEENEAENEFPRRWNPQPPAEQLSCSGCWLETEAVNRNSDKFSKNQGRLLR